MVMFKIEGLIQYIGCLFKPLYKSFYLDLLYPVLSSLVVVSCRPDLFQREIVGVMDLVEIPGKELEM